MPVHLTWDGVGEGYTVTIEVTPESGNTISGHLVITRAGQSDLVEELEFDDIVPSWSHTMGANETVHITLMVAFYTETTSNVQIVGKCRSPEGIKHQTDYSEPCSGKRDDIIHAYVWEN